jgi:hypothetical protein
MGAQVMIQKAQAVVLTMIIEMAKLKLWELK